MKHLILAATLLMTGCASTGVMSKTGIGLITMTTEPKIATNGKPHDKEGRACTTNILAIASTGDASIETAKRLADITEVSSVDEEYTNILLVYGKYCVIVHGS